MSPSDPTPDHQDDYDEDPVGTWGNPAALFVPCPRRGLHRALRECGYCAGDYFSGRCALSDLLVAPDPDLPDHWLVLPDYVPERVIEVVSVDESEFTCGTWRYVPAEWLRREEADDQRWDWEHPDGWRGGWT